jgi:MFS family permease
MLIALLREEWSLSPGEISLLGSLFYVGNTIGTVVCAFYTDRFGRRSIIIAVSAA